MNRLSRDELVTLCDALDTWAGCIAIGLEFKGRYQVEKAKLEASGNYDEETLKEMAENYFQEIFPEIQKTQYSRNRAATIIKGKLYEMQGDLEAQEAINRAMNNNQGSNQNDARG